MKVNKHYCTILNQELDHDRREEILEELQYHKQLIRSHGVLPKEYKDITQVKKYVLENEIGDLRTKLSRIKRRK
jgi:hypothetical protein